MNSLLTNRRRPSSDPPGSSPRRMLRYSNHAKKRLAQRRVTSDEVETVLSDPHVTYTDPKGNPCYVRDVNGKSIRVVVAADDPEFVITVIDRTESV